eukprot:Clim_evm44s146 gene=Clim_evmTU44s146
MDQPVVEHSLFDSLDDEPNDFEFRTEMAQEFLSGEQQVLQELAQIIQGGTAEDLKRAAHKEKSGALTLGFFRVAAGFSSLEQIGIGGMQSGNTDKAGAQALVMQLQKDYQELRAYLSQFLGQQL